MAGEIFMQMVGREVVPDSAIYAVMIDGYYKGGKVAESFAVCGKMIKQGVNPDEQIRGMLMSCYCSASNIEGCSPLGEEMDERGIDLNPITNDAWRNVPCMLGEVLDEISGEGSVPMG